MKLGYKLDSDLGILWQSLFSSNAADMWRIYREGEGDCSENLVTIKEILGAYREMAAIIAHKD